MRQTWRWFGPKDLAKIEDMLQAGVEGVVSALHHIPNGTIWEPAEIARRQAEIGKRSDGTPSGLKWEVVESLPVSEDIKKQKGDWRTHIANYKTSLENLSAAGIKIICYNFMPILDWTRTDLNWRVAHGGTCMRFDIVDFAAFDIHLLARFDASGDYAPEIVTRAHERFAQMSDGRKRELIDNITAGLPGSTEKLTLEGVRQQLAEYDHISADRLRANFIAFLEEVVPVAERLGMRMCCHPDDPPFPLMGLPRIMSTLEDYRTILSAVDSPANGATLCSGSLGVRPDNDLPAMMKALAPKVHFIHLRNVKRDSNAIAGSFFEDEHLAGDTDMVALIAAIMTEEARRKAEGRADHQIPMRPDHGQDILDDLGRKAQPGYPTIGRLKGLAELRGIMRTFDHPEFGLKRSAIND
ncbi:mannonate dehydratase [Pelagibacterium luteolum]|uniref:Mannonate dehydratase n=1 Tax=Pelagibacterium luteolum TaxID=440168 RepID=A0A1G7RXN6_9HYPH|nr:mannonate dehydratase [Pelagibacterium luteolum]SDG14989.1 mannonate dehydratase [Pelagibacterium luteolum]